MSLAVEPFVPREEERPTRITVGKRPEQPLGELRVVATLRALRQRPLHLNVPAVQNGVAQRGLKVLTFLANPPSPPTSRWRSATRQQHLDIPGYQTADRIWAWVLAPLSPRGHCVCGVHASALTR